MFVKIDEVGEIYVVSFSEGLTDYNYLYHFDSALLTPNTTHHLRALLQPQGSITLPTSAYEREEIFKIIHTLKHELSPHYAFADALHQNHIMEFMHCIFKMLTDPVKKFE